MAPFIPEAPAVTGLAGLAGGYEVGHLVHKTITNKAEQFLSTASTYATIVSDIELGNTRIDGFYSYGKVTIGEQTASSVVMSIVGNYSNSGIFDAGIDIAGSLMSEGRMPGIYHWFGVEGKSVYAGGAIYPSFIKFGDP